jgi:Cu/Ag efflux pump CusA
MGAIDFGILLEGAVILVENAYRHLALEKPPPRASRTSWPNPPRR